MQADVKVDAAADRSLKSKIDFFATAIKTNEEKKLQSVGHDKKAPTDVYQIKKEKKLQSVGHDKKAPTDIYQIKKASDILVGAIDFGTTYSGWAILFTHEFQSEPTKGYVKQWQSSSSTLITEKTPTVVLIRPDGETLEAFGYEAEDRYRELAEEGDHENYYYFRRFKMTLHKQLGETIDYGMKLKDEMGHKLRALDVFSLVIRYLVDDMHKVSKDRILGSIKKSEVHWVITVPAIWTDSAKQFMRKAGEQAGIAPSKLTIALEPEAASIFCRHLPIEKRLDKTREDIASFPVGTRYMILDAGGGTIDITVHEVQRSGAVKEIKAASGGGWGGILVDEAFEKLMIDIVGKNVYNAFRHEQTEDWLDLWRDFEVKKRNTHPEKDAKIVMRMAPSLNQMCEKENRKNLTETVQSSGYRDDIQFTGDKMKFQSSCFKKLFDTSISKTIQHTENLFRDREVQQIKAILMVGGFSESPMLQKAVKSAFPGIYIIIPSEASSAIMRGAMIFGHSPKSISERVLKYTYGVRACVPFSKGKHQEKRRIFCDVGVMCNDVFYKHVERNQVVKVGEPQVSSPNRPVNRDQDIMLFQLYASELKNPMYIDEDCKYVGKMSVKLPDHDGDLDRAVWVSLTFSGTEIEVEGKDERSGEKTKVSLDFFG